MPRFVCLFFSEGVKGLGLLVCSTWKRASFVFAKYPPTRKSSSAPAAVSSSSTEPSEASPRRRRTEASGAMSRTAAAHAALRPPGGATISTGLSAASVALAPVSAASSRQAPTRNRPAAQSAAHAPIQGPPARASPASPASPPSWSIGISTSATTYAASGLASVIAASTSVPRVSTPTFSRATTESFAPAARRAASCAGVSTCSTTTTRCPARARRSALAA